MVEVVRGTPDLDAYVIACFGDPGVDAARELVAARRDIEIERMPTGQPAVRLHGRAAQRAEQLGMERIAVSI